MDDTHTTDSISRLLDEAKRRQMLVDQARGISRWSQLANGSLTGLGTAAIFGLVNSVVPAETWWLRLLLAITVSAAFWSSFDTVQLRRRLSALTAVLEESGALNDFLERAVPTDISDATRRKL